MNIKTELIRVAVRALSEKTTLVPRPDATSEFINALFGIESQEDRLVREIDAATQKFTNGVRHGYQTRRSNRLTK